MRVTAADEEDFELDLNTNDEEADNLLHNNCYLDLYDYSQKLGNDKAGNTGFADGTTTGKPTPDFAESGSPHGSLDSMSSSST